MLQSRHPVSLADAANACSARPPKKRGKQTPAKAQQTRRFPKMATVLSRMWRLLLTRLLIRLFGQPLTQLFAHLWMLTEPNF